MPTMATDRIGRWVTGMIVVLTVIWVAYRHVALRTSANQILAEVETIVPPVSLDSSSATLPGCRREEALNVSEYGSAGFDEEPREAGRPAEAVERAADESKDAAPMRVTLTRHAIASDPNRPPVRTQSDIALELTEIATYTLPLGMTVEGAALSPSGARVVVWGSRPRGFLYFERGVGGARSVPRERLPPEEIAGVAFLDDSTLGIIHAGGRVSAVEWGSWKHRTSRVIPVSGIRSAALGDGGWWLLAEGTGEDAALHFLPGDGVSSPKHVMPLAASPDRAFLATAGTDALVALRDSPFLVWRIGVDGDVVAGMQPDRPPSNGTAERDPPPRWMGLSALSVAPGVVQVIADVTSDDRLLVTYDDRGDVVSSRVLQAPFGLVAVASHARILAALRTFEASEIVLYSWRWRLRAPAGSGSLPERRNSDA